MRSLKRFLRDERGITTIEWVAITVVAMLAAFGISNMVLQGADDLGGSVANRMSDAADDLDGD